MKKKLGIYIHIPFCVRKCAYCDFLSAPADEATRTAYVRALREEIRSAGELNETYEGATVFFGGGTPSLLAGEELTGILGEVSRRLLLRSDAEITVECNPGTLDRKKLEEYKAAGMNRLSIGLQSADNRELKILGRIHTWEQFRENYALARDIGFQNVNIDLMSALPGQTREGWLSTLEKVAMLDPEHISAYSMIIEEGTPFYEKYREDGPEEAELPGEDLDRIMYEDTKAFLQGKGYERYEISNYAKPGYECRHNCSYWERVDYKGFGIGAASLLNGVRYQNSADLQEYLKGHYTYESVEPLSAGDVLEETMFLGLREMRGVALNDTIQNIYSEQIKRLTEADLLEQAGDRIRLTDRGIDISNYVLSEFLLDEKTGGAYGAAGALGGTPAGAAGGADPGAGGFRGQWV